MRRLIVIGLTGMVLAAPTLPLVAVAVLFNPAGRSQCLNPPPVLVAATDTLGDLSDGVIAVPQTTRVVMPLATTNPTVMTPFDADHPGVEFAVAVTSPVVAIADGVVRTVSTTSDGRTTATVEHRVEGSAVFTTYQALAEGTVTVVEGQWVNAGQHLADIHQRLYLGLRIGGPTEPPVDPLAWLNEHDAVLLTVPSGGGHGCSPVGIPGAPTPYAGPPGGRLPDPTGTGGFVTYATAHMIAQTRAVFPASRWACWSPRPGTTSQHPLGRACDVTYGNRIGEYPTPDQVAEGWRMTLWLQQNAAALHVEYLIWQGLIWSVARDAEGWRPYNGGGMHDPTTPTGGHFDHLHITVGP